MIEDFLYARLNGATDAGDRVYPNTLPQNKARPALIYTQVGGGSDYAMYGSIGLARARVMIAAIADDYDTARNVFEQARLLLDGFAGTLALTVVQGCFMDPDSKRDTPYIAAGNEPQTRFGKQAEFDIEFEEAIPS